MSDDLPDDLVRRIDRLIKAGREFCGYLKLWPRLEGQTSLHLLEIHLGAPAFDLATALRAISAEEESQLSVYARTGLRRFRRQFTDLVRDRWKWPFIFDEGGLRYMSERIEWFRANVIEPLQAAARAIEKEGTEGEASDQIVSDAWSAEQILRISPMPIEEACARHPGLVNQKETVLLFGPVSPTWEPKAVDDLERSLSKIEFGTVTPRVLLQLAERSGHQDTSALPAETPQGSSEPLLTVEKDPVLTRPATGAKQPTPAPSKQPDAASEKPDWETVLGETDWCILGALDKLKSHGRSSRSTQVKIVERAGTGEHDSKHNQNSFKKLKSHNLIDSCKGTGTWITNLGCCSNR